MSDAFQAEKAKQAGFTWERSCDFATYNEYLGYYQAQSCLAHARGDSLLDVPCGDGTLTRYFLPRFKRIVGVDASSLHLAKARARLPTIEFHEGLLEEMDFRERFDTVAMLNILEHVIDPVAALRKVATFLTAEGVLVVHVPNAVAVNRRIAVLMGTLTTCEELSPFDINVAGHRRSYTLSTLLEDVTAAGLRVTATGGVFYKMLSTPQMDWFLANGPWDQGGFGWGRLGAHARDWRAEFCRACYEYGNQQPEDCNIVYVCATK